MIMNSLSDLVKFYVAPLVEANKGWSKCRCMVCDDHYPGSSNFKGLRGNFNLCENKIAYSCFNCDTKAVFDPMNSAAFSKTMLKVFDSFGIPALEYNNILLDLFGNKASVTAAPANSLNVEPGALTFPKHFYSLKDADPEDKWAVIARHYLMNRHIDPDTYDFYLSDGTGKFGKKWKGRVIFPIYKDGKLVFYQGRSLVSSIKKRYENPSVDKAAVLYNYDEIFTYSKKPIFVVEGFFDAFLINGCALIGKNITKEQAYWLNKSKRTKIIIPDREGDGKRIALQAIKLGWSVAFPNFGECKDVSDAYNKYGKLYVMSEIMSNIYDSSNAKLMLDLYVKS